MFDMTAMEREILEEHATRMEENGRRLFDRVKAFFEFDGEIRDCGRAPVSRRRSACRRRQSLLYYRSER